jgi:hypothetical protein
MEKVLKASVKTRLLLQQRFLFLKIKAFYINGHHKKNG